MIVERGWSRGATTVRHRYNVPSRGRETGSTLTTDLQGCLKLQQDGLTEEDLPGFDTQAPHLCLGHLDDLPRAASSDWQRRKRSVNVRCLSCNASCRQIPQHILGFSW